MPFRGKGKIIQFQGWLLSKLFCPPSELRSTVNGKPNSTLLKKYYFQKTAENLPCVSSPNVSPVRVPSIVYFNRKITKLRPFVHPQVKQPVPNNLIKDSAALSNTINCI